MPKYENYSYYCKCGKGFHTGRALSVHKDQKGHW